MKTKLIFSILMLTASTAIATGGEGGGGGKGLVCPVAGGKTAVYLADTFDLKQSGELDKLAPADPAAIVASAALVVDSTFPAKVFPHPFVRGQKVTLGYMIAYRYQQLDFNYVKGSLPDFPDDHIDLSKFPAGCQKEQLAIQNIAAKVVNETMRVEDLSWVERGFLDLHETLISLRDEPGADTTPIRKTVESIALQMGQPNSAVRAKIIALLKAPFIQTGVITDAAAMDIIQKECGGYMLDPKPQPNDDAKTKRCRQASATLGAANRAYDAATSIPTMLHAPRKLTCEVNAAGQNPLKIARPRSVSMELVGGQGLPGGNYAENTFRITVDGKSTDSRRSWFTTQRTSREDGFRGYGSTDLRTYFVTNEGKNITLTLSRYDDLTQTLQGSISFADPTVLSYPNDSWYTITCYSGPVQFGLDLVNSNPTSREVKAPPTPILERGCKGILLADETRTQYKHDVLVLARLVLNPANFKTLRRYKFIEKKIYAPNSSDANYEKYAEEEQKLSQTQVVQAYRKVLVVGENSLRCVEFRGE